MNETICPDCQIPHEAASGERHPCPLVDHVLADGFRLLGRVGRIPLGMLYSAESVDDQVELQLVVLHDRETDDLVALRQRLSRAAAITHPNVATVRAIGDTPDGLCYVVFEAVRGMPLSEIVETRRALPLAEAIDLILQAAAGLQAAHEAGVPHGGVSPETVLVTRSPDGGPRVKLIRFDLLQQGGEAPDPGEALPGFAAPERPTEQSPSVGSDVYSLGAVLYFVLAGAPPCGETDWLKPIPEALRPTLSRALHPLPEGRFESIAALALSLREALGTDQTGRRAQAFAQRMRAAGAAALVLSVVAIGTRIQRTDKAAPEVSRTSLEAHESRVTGRLSKRAPPPSLAATTREAPREAPRTGPPPGEPSRWSRAEAQPLESVETPPPPAQGGELGRPRPVPAETSAATPPSNTAPAPSVAAHPLAEMARPPADTAPATPGALAASADSVTAPVDTLPTRTDSSPFGVPAPPTAPAPRREPPPPPSAARVPDPEAAGRAAAQRALATYAQALESSDLKAVERAYPGITARERAAWRKFFGVARDLVVTLNIDRLTHAGSEVRLDVQGTYQYWNRSVSRFERAPVRFLATVRRDRDDWRLVAIR